MTADPTGIATLRDATAREVRPYLDDMVAIYLRALGKPPRVAAARRGLMEQHLAYAGYRAVLAQDGQGALVGFCYAYHGAPGQWWHDQVRAGLGRTRAAQWLADAVEIVELHVEPARQHRGIGRRMITRVLAASRERTAVLSTYDVQSPARALYRSLGFTDLLTGFRFPGNAEVYAVMGRRQPPGEPGGEAVGGAAGVAGGTAG